MIEFGNKEAASIHIGGKEVQTITIGGKTAYEKSSPPPSVDYFYVKSLANSNTLTLTTTGSPETFEYSTDKTTWYSSTNLSTTTLNNGDYFYMRSNHGLNKSDRAFHNIVCSGNCEVGGDVRTLVDYSDSSVYSIPNWNFFKLFYNNRGLIDSSGISMTNITTVGEGSFKQMFHDCRAMTSTISTLPATTLGTGCYNAMYYHCDVLTSAPSLPATTLEDDCYHNMFRNCAALTVAPSLPATTLTSECYRIMFSECTSLTTPPVLPATTLASYCYANMFDGCSALNNITTYANNISATNCIQNWLRNVANSGTFYNNGSATYTPNSASGIPTGWTEVKPTPPTPTVDYLYIQNTYAGQNTITFTTTKKGSPSSTYYSDSVEYSKNGFDFTTLNFVEGTPSTLTLEEGEKLYLRNDSGTWNYYSSSNTNYHTTITCSQTHTVGGNIKSLVDYTDMTSAMQYSGCFSYLFDGDSTLTSSSNLVMDDDTMVSYAYMYTFQKCTSMTSTVSSLPATTLAGNCYNHMYYYCSALTAAPSLPATSVTASAYQFMFSYCNSLTTAPSISATEVEKKGMYSMFSRCTSLTTAVLLVTTAGDEAFKQMFYYCSAFNSVTTEITDISATDCLSDWLFGVSNTGTLYNNGSATYTPNSASGIPTGWTEVKPTPPTPTVDYLYIQNTYAGQNDITLETIEGSVAPPSNTHATSVEYSKDLTNWTTITFVTGSANAQTITMNQGEKVYFRNSSGKFNYESTTNGNYRTSFKNSESCVVGGDVRTIIDYNNYQTVTLPQGCFYQLFSGNTELTDASALKLPSTAIPDFGYKMMFNANLNLTAAPDIDATSVGEFGCDWMFKSCILLQTAPELKSATLSTGSYERMFQGCSLLNSVTIDANDISAEFCLLDWLDGVAATGDFYNNGSATYPSGSSGIPTGWTVHTPL